MDIHVEPDRDKREEIEREKQAILKQEDIDRRTSKLLKGKMGKFDIWAPENAPKLALTPVQKIARDRLNATLTEKAENRDLHCWRGDVGCKNKAMRWVREVQFDIMDMNQEIDHATVTSADYIGPVPGLCLVHSTQNDAAKLAETVYFARPEMRWGYKPVRWFVIYTDGSKDGGVCIKLDPKQIQPDVIDEYIPGEKND